MLEYLMNIMSSETWKIAVICLCGTVENRKYRIRHIWINEFYFATFTWSLAIKILSLLTANDVDKLMYDRHSNNRFSKEMSTIKH